MKTDPPQFPIPRSNLDPLLLNVYTSIFQDDWPADQLLTHPEPRQAYVATVLAIAHRRGWATDETAILSGLLALRKGGKLAAPLRKMAKAQTA